MLLRCLKNAVIGSNRQKATVFSEGVVPRLKQLLRDPSVPIHIKTEATVTLGSLAKGTDDHVQALVDNGIVPILLSGKFSIIQTYDLFPSIEQLYLFKISKSVKPLIYVSGITSTDTRLSEVSLRCLCTIFQSQTPPVEVIYMDQGLIPVLLELTSRSITNQICVTTILAASCKVRP